MNRWAFRPDYVGIRKLAFLPGLAVPLMGRAAQLAGDAKQLAGSDRVAQGITADGPEVDQTSMVAFVNANHWTSAFVEFGTVHQPPTAMLRRAAEQGGRFNKRQR